MPVTEIALLHLKTPTPSDPLKAVFHEAQQEQSQYSGHRVNFLRSLDDRSDFFLLGGWESVALHCGEWVTSEINQRLLAKLKDEVDIGYMFHLDVDVSLDIKRQEGTGMKLTLSHSPLLLSRSQHQSSEWPAASLKKRTRRNLIVSLKRVCPIWKTSRLLIPALEVGELTRRVRMKSLFF